MKDLGIHFENDLSFKINHKIILKQIIKYAWIYKYKFSTI